jgi:hypothetical protein
MSSCSVISINIYNYNMLDSKINGAAGEIEEDKDEAQ